MGSSSKTTTSKTVYGNTTTSNPYVTSSTNNSGTATNFKSGTAFDTINKFINSNMDNLLDEYINPSLNTTTNKAKLNNFISNLNTETTKNLENNIINNLSNRNMIRSSQATDLYNNLAATNSNAISDYANELLSNSQSDTASVLKNLLAAYISGYNTISDTQKQSLNTSQGNATKTSTTSSNDSAIDTSSIVNLAMMMALSNL